MKKRVVSLVGAFALLLGLSGITATTANAAPEGSCGLIHSNVTHHDYYSNCSSFNAKIRIIWNSSHDPSEMCVGNGITPLGVYYSVSQAYTFATCDPTLS